MVVDIVAHTRKYLGTEDAINCVQMILKKLVPDYLDKILHEGGEVTGERLHLDVTRDGALIELVRKELARATESSKGWKLLLTDYPNPAPFERLLGGVYLIQPDETKEVFFDFDEYQLAPNIDKLQFGNLLCVNSDESNCRGDTLGEKVLAAAMRIFDNDLFDYGYCCPADQYDAKNLDRTGGGVCAVGLDASKYLPGFYWGNYFGPFLCDLIGEDVLMSAPGCCSYRLQSGVLVTNELPPDFWSQPAFIKNENEAMNHIGRHLFFEKGKVMDGKLFS